jgi:hypothetical protein
VSHLFFSVGGGVMDLHTALLELARADHQLEQLLRPT